MRYTNAKWEYDFQRTVFEWKYSAYCIHDENYEYSTCNVQLEDIQ